MAPMSHILPTLVESTHQNQVNVSSQAALRYEDLCFKHSYSLTLEVSILLTCVFPALLNLLKKCHINGDFLNQNVDMAYGWHKIWGKETWGLLVLVHVHF